MGTIVSNLVSVSLSLRTREPPGAFDTVVETEKNEKKTLLYLPLIKLHLLSLIHPVAMETNNLISSFQSSFKQPQLQNLQKVTLEEPLATNFSQKWSW